eukprot:6293893-Amphidinium_carterae.2
MSEMRMSVPNMLVLAVAWGIHLKVLHSSRSTLQLHPTQLVFCIWLADAHMPMSGGLGSSLCLRRCFCESAKAATCEPNEFRAAAISAHYAAHGLFLIAKDRVSHSPCGMILTPQKDRFTSNRFYCHKSTATEVVASVFSTRVFSRRQTACSLDRCERLLHSCPQEEPVWLVTLKRAQSSTLVVGDAVWLAADRRETRLCELSFWRLWLA